MMYDKSHILMIRKHNTIITILTWLILMIRENNKRTRTSAGDWGSASGSKVTLTFATCTDLRKSSDRSVKIDLSTVTFLSPAASMVYDYIYVCIYVHQSTKSGSLVGGRYLSFRLNKMCRTENRAPSDIPGEKNIRWSLSLELYIQPWKVVVGSRKRIGMWNITKKLVIMDPSLTNTVTVAITHYCSIDANVANSRSLLSSPHHSQIWERQVSPLCCFSRESLPLLGGLDTKPTRTCTCKPFPSRQTVVTKLGSLKTRFVKFDNVSILGMSLKTEIDLTKVNSILYSCTPEETLPILQYLVYSKGYPSNATYWS